MVFVKKHSLLILLVLAVACTPPRIGVWFYGRIKEMPAAQCIVDAIRITPQVQIGDIRQISGTYENHADQIIRYDLTEFPYHYGGYKMSVIVGSSSDALDFRFEHYYYHPYIGPDGNLAQEAVDTVKPILQAVQKNIEAKCNFQPVEPIKEECKIRHILGSTDCRD